MFLSQTKLIKELLVKLGINDDKPISLLTVQGVRLEKNTELASKHIIKLYQQHIKSLIYLITATRPDLAFLVSNYARFISNPSEKHIKALQRI